MKYYAQKENNDPLMEYYANTSSKYSSALAVIKGYEKSGLLNTHIIEEGSREIITREQCEFILK